MTLHPLCKQLAACGALALLASAAQADVYDFVLTGPDTASWQLDSMPRPTGSVAGNNFSIDAAGTRQGCQRRHPAELLRRLGWRRALCPRLQ